MTSVRYLDGWKWLEDGVAWWDGLESLRKWLATHLKGEVFPAPPLLEMQLRSNKQQREQFDLWPSARIERTTLVPWHWSSLGTERNDDDSSATNSVAQHRTAV